MTNKDQQIGIIDETAYIAYEGQGFDPLTEEQQKHVKENTDDE